MYIPTPEQLAAEKRLGRQGFRFLNWIDAYDGNEEHGCMVLARKVSRFGKQYREIDPNGHIGGE